MRKRTNFTATYLNRELLPISLNKDWLASIFKGKGKLSGAILRLNHLKLHKLANKDCQKLSTSTVTSRLEECLFSWHPLDLQRHFTRFLQRPVAVFQGYKCYKCWKNSIVLKLDEIY
jgi:hypothetical protein